MLCNVWSLKMILNRVTVQGNWHLLEMCYRQLWKSNNKKTNKHSWTRILNIVLTDSPYQLVLCLLSINLSKSNHIVLRLSSHCELEWYCQSFPSRAKRLQDGKTSGTLIWLQSEAQHCPAISCTHLAAATRFSLMSNFKYITTGVFLN